MHNLAVNASRITVGLVLAGLTFVLAPASAPAQSAPAANSAESAGSSVLADSSLTARIKDAPSKSYLLVAVLRREQAPYPGQEIMIQVWDGSRWDSRAEVTTTKSGRASFGVVPATPFRQLTQYRFRYAGNATTEPATSEPFAL